MCLYASMDGNERVVFLKFFSQLTSQLECQNITIFGDFNVILGGLRTCFSKRLSSFP